MVPIQAVAWQILFYRDISSYITSQEYHDLYLSIMKDLKTLIDPQIRINYAAKHGYDILVHDLLTLNKNIDYNRVMANAARYGHANIVKMMLQYGANDYNAVMAKAAFGGHDEIVQLMLQYGANDYNLAMANAAYGGHENIVKLMLKLGANHYNWTIVEAAKGGYENIVKLMLELGGNNYSDVMHYAYANRHDNIINLIQQWQNTHR